MSYQKTTGALMANSHPGSYCGQDAYSDMLVTTDGRTVLRGVSTGECRNYEGGCPTLNASHEQPYTAGENTAVRRLTPTECERLQGFPDGWTDLGDWVDSTGKTRKAADSPRYKALGNSLALPFWKVLARRICAQYERDVTMGSLFDGIGGFPVCFKLAGAHPLWASEIDEFPRAVCKKHFGDEDAGQKGDFWMYFEE